MTISANFLRINIYLTQKLDQATVWNIVVNDAGAQYDPLTLLRTRTMYGRPDWSSIYTNIRNAIETGQYLPGSKSQLRTRVGTYFCGVCLDTCLLGYKSLMLRFLYSPTFWPRQFVMRATRQLPRQSSSPSQRNTSRRRDVAQRRTSMLNGDRYEDPQDVGDRRLFHAATAPSNHSCFGLYFSFTSPLCSTMVSAMINI